MNPLNDFDGNINISIIFSDLTIKKGNINGNTVGIYKDELFLFDVKQENFNKKINLVCSNNIYSDFEKYDVKNLNCSTSFKNYHIRNLNSFVALCNNSYLIYI